MIMKNPMNEMNNEQREMYGFFFLLNKLFQNNLLNIFHLLKVKTVVLYMIALGSKCKWGGGDGKGGGGGHVFLAWCAIGS